MNKTKRVAWAKHRAKRKKMEEKSKQQRPVTSGGRR